MGALRPRPVNYINLSQNNDFKCAYFVIHGEENINQFKMEDLTAYRTELENLVELRVHIRQAVMTIVFWRGHKEIKLFGFKFRLPLHSMIAFFLGATLVENLNLLPSYSLFCVSWLLAATNERRMQNPSPWQSSVPIATAWRAVLLNRSIPQDISDHENEAAIRAYEENLRRQYEQEKADAKERKEAADAIAEFVSSGSTQPEEVDSNQATKLTVGRPTINPLAKALFPIQKVLGQVCRILWIVRSVIMWDECYLAFAIWNGCLLLGVAFLWIPWSLIVKWTARILIWTLLGPWMKLVDLFVLPRILGTDVKDKDEALHNMAREKMKNIGVAREIILRKREEILKERAMKRYMVSGQRIDLQSQNCYLSCLTFISRFASSVDIV